MTFSIVLSEPKKACGSKFISNYVSVKVVNISIINKKLILIISKQLIWISYDLSDSTGDSFKANQFATEYIVAIASWHV